MILTIHKQTPMKQQQQQQQQKPKQLSNEIKLQNKTEIELFDGAKSYPILPDKQYKFSDTNTNIMLLIEDLYIGEREK